MKKPIGFFVALILALILSGFSFVPARADSGEIDLKLGGEGAMSWQIANINPGASGTKTVTLHNAGSLNGFVTIWITDFKETDFAGNGAWLDDYVLFDVSADRLTTNLSWPLKIVKFPQDASGNPNYLRINYLGAGETITLIWHWHFLAEAGNEAQGDGFSFTINYKLEGIPPPTQGYWEPQAGTTYFSDSINWKGVITKTVIAESFDKKCRLIIEKGITALTRSRDPLSWVRMSEMVNPPAPPKDAHIIGILYDFQPSGATFDPPATLEYHYETDEIPEGVDEGSLVIAFWDAAAGQWVNLDCLVDTATRTITAKLAHFTVFGIFGYQATVPPVIPPVTPTPTITPVPPVIPVPPKPIPTVPPITPVPSVPLPPKPETPTETATPLILSVGETNWPLVGGTIAGVLVFAGIGYLIRKKRVR